MSWRKISSQGIGTGDAIFAPFQMQNFFQDGNTGSHEKASQGVGIEKAVFTSSKRRIFFFSLPGKARKRQNAAQPDKRSGLFIGDCGFPNKQKARLPASPVTVLSRFCITGTLLAKD